MFDNNSEAYVGYQDVHSVRSAVSAILKNVYLWMTMALAISGLTAMLVAGNAELVDDMAYNAIASNHKIKILFREHVILSDGKLDKKFDFIMLYGNSPSTKW